MIPQTNNSKNKMVDLLFGKDKFQEVGTMIRKLWQRRRKILADIQKENTTRSQPIRGKRNTTHPSMVQMLSDPGPMREGQAQPRMRSL